ncbi:MAG: response regulator, partial [Acidimicrobiia bacterium]|nr:response regulator [Acidimicrobiia bacterium]
MTTVVLAEDSFIVREGVRMLLEEAGYELLAVAEDYDELVEAVDAEPPDVVITDIRMPPTRTDEGIRAAREIR